MKAFLSSTKGLLALGLFLTFSLPAVAQPGSGGPGPDVPTADPTAVPLDGGVSLLLAGGVAYGLKQLKNRRLARKAAR